MTCVAWDGTTLAVDSRMTAGGTVISDKFVKMVEVEHPEFGTLVGAIAGTCLYIGPWLVNIQKEGFAPVVLSGGIDEETGGLSGLFIDSEGNCWEATTHGGFFPHGKNPTALGSGTSVAIYLLKKGKKAVDVVKAACESNLYCGGDIRSYNSRTKKYTVLEEVKD